MQMPIQCCSKKCSFTYSQRATIRNYLSYLSEFFGIHLPINSEKFFRRKSTSQRRHLTYRNKPLIQMLEMRDAIHVYGYR